MASFGGWVLPSLKENDVKGMLLAVLLACFSPSVWAVQYTQVVPEQSEIRFEYKQMGVVMPGQFKQFSGELAFDTTQPEQGSAVIEIPLSSVDAGSDDADSELAGSDWFDTTNFPVARFESTSIQPTGSNSYTVNGTLTIKGQAKPVTVPAQLSEQEGMGVLEGRYTIMRGDFGVGAGAWSGFDIVANEIEVVFRIAAKP